jgi:murein DD-endopeptidase MepM/ murein hydrolase activator NlpD
VAPAPPTVAGVFPVQGAFGFGGDDARFGAGRTGHIHQGQDVVADSGTPIVAPIAGTITWKANQPSAAGIYLVMRGAGGDSGDVRDYVFMHIKRGTVLVAPGDVVQAGQQLAQVGATGDASGPHLHFEIWLGGWFVRGGAPVDPLPQLQAWAGL